MNWLDRLLWRWFHERLDVLVRDNAARIAQAEVTRLWADFLTPLRTIIHNRRTEMQRPKMEDTLNLLINALEAEEEKKRKYATMLWNLVGEVGLPQPKILELQQRVGAFDPYRPF